jgi:hypothetical protein
MSWKPINGHWTFVDRDIDQIITRLPQCLVAAKTRTCVVRLLSLIEEMDRAMGLSWTEMAFKETR